MRQSVLVLGRDRSPLMPCSPARARMLLKAGRAAIL
ncbi:MAG: RRXRR domain-containing protein, partial [Firmicutes bacterium]|nr:RRXRR domain-containing protein [Bacillota bacterium]